MMIMVMIMVMSITFFFFQFKRNRMGHIRKLTDLELKVQPMDNIVTKECREKLVTK